MATTDKKLELLNGLISQVETISHRDNGSLDAIKQRTIMIITKVFGTGSGYHHSLKSISFSPSFYVSGTGSGPFDSAWRSGMTKFKNLLNTMKEDYLLEAELSTYQHDGLSNKDKENNHNKVFIVHGHNDAMKESVARLVEQLRLEAIILHEQPNKGRTIIEKFTDYSDVGFVIVLLSGDDFAFPKSAASKNKKLRARQNVILELGFFIGRLGRDKVVGLFEQIDEFEFPSDYNGVLYTAYDPDGKWRFDIARELKASGFKIDVNVLL